MAKTRKTLKVGDVYEGPKGIFDDDSVGGVHGFYALDEESNLLKQNGKPVRLMQVDLAPGDPEDGSEEYRVAGANHPSQAIAVDGRVVGLEIDDIAVKSKLMEG